MLKKEQKQRQCVEMLCTDMVVPKNHLLRKIDAAVNFDRIYEMVEPLYCKDNGRPSIDPVVLFKLVLIEHLYGIRSLRQTVKDAEVNVAYRWFIGYTMAQSIPHFATISYAFATRFSSKVIEQVFAWILDEANEAGCLDLEAVFMDGTHIKANANLKKHIKKVILQTARHYGEQLMEEVNQDREEHGKSLWMMTIQSLPKRRQSLNPQPTRRVAFSIKASTKNALPTKRIPFATNTTSYWM